MKKLMIAAAIVCAAACSQAGAFVWGLGGGVLAPDASYDTDEDGYLDADLATATLYVMVGSDWTEIDTARDEGSLTYGPMDDADLSFDSRINQLASKGDTEKLQQYKIIIATDDGKYSYELAPTSADPASVVALDETFYQSMNNYDEITLTAVPEPTSGLLLLLGVAGLALRRRRA